MQALLLPGTHIHKVYYSFLWLLLIPSSGRYLPVMCAACCMNAESAAPRMHASRATPACCAAKMQFMTGMYCSGVSAPASKLSMRGLALWRVLAPYRDSRRLV
jgi:hypothetical protein